MGRVTYNFNGCWQVKGTDNLECRKVCETMDENGCKDCPIGKAFDRLAAFENTGLEPSEILCEDDMKNVITSLEELNQYKRLGTLDRLRELVAADMIRRLFIFNSVGVAEQPLTDMREIVKQINQMVHRDADASAKATEVTNDKSDPDPASSIVGRNQSWIMGRFLKEE